jgi:hypothetical protein
MLLPILLASERHDIDWLALIYLNQPSLGAFLDREHFMAGAFEQDVLPVVLTWSHIQLRI